jgi:uncharacterized membrane protein
MILSKSTRLLLPMIGLAAVVGFVLPTSPAAAQPPAPIHRLHRERHPELRQALRRLQAAQNSLQHAAHDFQGHREKALDLVQQAIEQIKLAIASDKH